LRVQALAEAGDDAADIRQILRQRRAREGVAEVEPIAGREIWLKAGQDASPRTGVGERVRPAACRQRCALCLPVALSVVLAGSLPRRRRSGDPASYAG
jgi:hypothetical protein